MTYVGVDVAKKTHYACITSENNKVLTAPFAFDNDDVGYAKLRIAVEKFPKDEVVVGLESTSIYGENLIAFLARLGYQVALINPIETAGVRKSKIRKTKTDKIDSRNICEYLVKSEYRLLQLKELQMVSLRGLCRFLQSLKKTNARLKTQIVSYLDVTFPEYQTLFNPVHGKGSLAVLMEFPSAQAIAKANVLKLTNILREASNKCLGRARADELKALAKRSVAAPSFDLSFQIRTAIEQLRFVQSQIEDTKNRIAEMYDSMDSVIKTVPGIGPITGSMILSEIGDIKRFSKPRQLIAFAGLDPVVSQSGSFNAQSTRMSKRGSSTFRYALVTAAWQATLNSPYFAKYYEEKRAIKGRHYATLGHVAGKLVKVIFTMLKNDVPFNESKLCAEAA